MRADRCGVVEVHVVCARDLHKLEGARSFLQAGNLALIPLGVRTAQAVVRHDEHGVAGDVVQEAVDHRLW